MVLIEKGIFWVQLWSKPHSSVSGACWVSAPFYLFSWVVLQVAGGKKWLHFKSIFQVEPTGYADGLDKVYEEGRSPGHL